MSSITEFGELQLAFSKADCRYELQNNDAIQDKIVQLIKNRLPQDGVLSLDVFDTFLLRNNRSEIGRFYDIAKLIANKLPDTKPIDVFLARYLATRACYRASDIVSGCREGSLTEIYKTVTRFLGLPVDSTEEFIKIELSYEADNLRVNPSLMKAARMHLRRGGVVIMLSDMYMHKDQISWILKRLSVGGDMDIKIYSSADYKVSKSSRGIFSLVEKDLNVLPNAILHVGDSIKSDFKNPISHKWLTLHLPISWPENKKRLADHFEMKKYLFNEFAIDVDIAPPHC